MVVRRSINELVSPFGVLSELREHVFWGPADLAGFIGNVGDPPPSDTNTSVLSGGRSSESVELARVKAIAEGAERYAAADILGEKRIRLSGREVHNDHSFLEPWRFPRCSEAEYTDSRCSLKPFDPEASIRWVRGVDLYSGRDTWVPAAMATYRLVRMDPSERFTYAISTGYAVHTDPVEAALRGLLEVVERDIVSLVWLQRMPLPLVDDSVRTPLVTGLVEWLEQRFVSTYLFDATSDIGVPSVYCLLSSAHDPFCARIIAASAERDMATAAEKALHEAMSIIPIVRARRGEIERVEDIKDVEDGAVYMGRRERSSAFDFLTEGAEKRSRKSRSPLPSSPESALRVVVERLHDLGARVVGVDRTSEELESVGLKCFNMVVPDLQPMSLEPFAQFKAHRRLFEAPRRMGYEVYDEKGLNPWPQPFV